MRVPAPVVTAERNRPGLEEPSAPRGRRYLPGAGGGSRWAPEAPRCPARVTPSPSGGPGPGRERSDGRQRDQERVSAGQGRPVPGEGANPAGAGQGPAGESETPGSGQPGPGRAGAGRCQAVPRGQRGGGGRAARGGEDPGGPRGARVRSLPGPGRPGGPLTVGAGEPGGSCQAQGDPAGRGEARGVPAGLGGGGGPGVPRPHSPPLSARRKRNVKAPTPRRRGGGRRGGRTRIASRPRRQVTYGRGPGGAERSGHASGPRGRGRGLSVGGRGLGAGAALLRQWAGPRGPRVSPGMVTARGPGCHPR